MCESDKDSVEVLIAVDNAQFASAIINALKTFAPFPIRAAFTNSLQHAIGYLDQFSVDILLIDTFLVDSRNEISVRKIRERTKSPVIAFVKSALPELIDEVKRAGAERVVVRTDVDPVRLVRAVEEIAGDLWEKRKTPCVRAQTVTRGYVAHEADLNPRSVSPRCIGVAVRRTAGNTRRTTEMHVLAGVGPRIDNGAHSRVPASRGNGEHVWTSTTALPDAATIGWRERLRGVQKLYEILVEHRVPPEEQRRLLRRLLIDSLQKDDFI